MIPERKGLRSSPTATALVAWLACWAIATTFYLALTAQLGGEEVIAAAIGGLLAAAAYRATRRAGQLCYRPRIGWIADLPCVLGTVVRDCCTVFAAAGQAALGGRRLLGRLRSIPCPATGNDPQGAAERVALVVRTSLAPNQYVVGLEEGTLIVHELVNRSHRKRTRR